MKQDTRDYWSFVEKIQDATDYVQQLLTENDSLRHRMASLEREKKDLAEKLGTLRQLLHRERPEDPLLRYQLGQDGGEAPARVELPVAAPARIEPAVPAMMAPAHRPQPAPVLQAV